jgi:hypothetical protein
VATVIFNISLDIKAKERSQVIDSDKFPSLLIFQKILSAFTSVWFGYKVSPQKAQMLKASITLT